MPESLCDAQMKGEAWLLSTNFGRERYEDRTSTEPKWDYRSRREDELEEKENEENE